MNMGSVRDREIFVGDGSAPGESVVVGDDSGAPTPWKADCRVMGGNGGGGGPLKAGDGIPCGGGGGDGVMDGKCTEE